MTSEPGLRERKKAATRAALSHAAWTLMLEHGLDAATPEAIAEAAEVSARTFRNYFASREEAIVDELAQRYLTLADKIRDRPAGEPVWDSLIEVLPSAVPEIVGDRAKLAALMRVMTESPALRAQLLLVTEHLSTVMAQVVAERTGTDADRELAPRLLADTIGTAIGSSVGFWARSGTDAALPDLIRDSLTQLRAGLPIGAVAPAA
ncbi:TetR family transcriptional regulator [Planosporangium flavigriseum]|uniref:TetR family transcriptional regulator n=1 Tax=Planosporangium flavigriseum TaxID=373681 RepID=A0A8J3LT41_9ACTN|nr:TetR family transcriptional regulator [Planosporangium flavigriseum]NJC66576.1 TetR family transcriptional regulator [Planosporangium flavigriseum]GIG73449.1 TetR family transcriptional regulator [Planosporangium flavigriseum]